MYQSSFRHDRQTRQFTVRYTEHAGWEVVDAADARIVRRAVYQDWHRVERAMAMIKAEEDLLRRAGWRQSA
jgi:hypothetical protein